MMNAKPLLPVLWKHIICGLLCAGLFLLLTPYDVSAQGMADPSEVCTDGPQFKTDVPAGGGLVSNMTTDISALMSGLSESMFNKISVNADYQYALAGALTLYLDFVNLFLMLIRLLGDRR